jgi:endonuclease YncB( thermonuclease family)
MARAAINLAVAITSLSSDYADDTITGRARVIDGDTVTIGSQIIRFQGTDAPETDQVCLDDKGERWTCGVTARERLSSRIAVGAITCISHGEDRYG